MKKKVEIGFELADLRKSVDPPSADEVFLAIGYFTWWGDTYETVCIYKDGKCDMYAVYTKEDTGQTYTIGAIYRPEDKKYSFHS